MGTPGLALISLAIVLESNLGAPSGVGEKEGARSNDMNIPVFYLAINYDSLQDGKCSHNVTVSGKGVKDTFDVACKGGREVTSISTDNIAMYNNTGESLAFFTDTPSSLVVIKDGNCTKRTYKTFEDQTTYTESSMESPECENVKAKMEEAKQEWQTDFDEEMRKTFPPCFPFCKSQNPADDDGSVTTGPLQGKTEEAAEEYSTETEVSVSEEITEPDKNYDEFWREWQNNFDAKMEKKFPQCFPFCGKKKPTISIILQDDYDPSKPLKLRQIGSQSSVSHMESKESESIEDLEKVDESDINY